MNRIWVLGLTAIAFGLSGCASFVDQFARSFGDSATIARGDKTPPDVTLHVPSGDGEIVLHVSGAPATVPIKASDAFYVVAVAEDPEGVKSVGLSASQSILCTKDGQTQGASAAGTTSYEGPGSVGSTGLTRLWLPYEVTGKLITCAPGETNNSSYSIFVTGENFSGGRAQTQAVTFTPAP